MLDTAARTGAARTLLDLRDVTSGYGAAPVLHGVSLSVAPGEIVALVGKNGMGKTTLLKTALGILPLKAGAVLVDGTAATGLSPARLVALGVGYAPQEQPLFPDLSIATICGSRCARTATSRPASTTWRRASPSCGTARGNAPGLCRGGEQKMLILARALMMRPRLLLIDEISEGLQPSVVARIAAILRARAVRARDCNVGRGAEPRLRAWHRRSLGRAESAARSTTPAWPARRRAVASWST